MIGTGGSDCRRGEGYPAHTAATVKITNTHKEEINFTLKMEVADSSETSGSLTTKCHPRRHISLDTVARIGLPLFF